MLMSLHKHLNVKSIQYLSRLIANLDMNQHNEQTLLLSALLTKNLWFLMLDIGNNNNNNNSNNSKKECNKSSKLNNDLNNTKKKKKYEKQKVKIKLLNYSNKKNEKKNLVNNKKKQQQQQQQDISFAKELNSVDEFDEQNLDATSNASSTKNSIKSNCSSSGGGGVCRVVDDVDDDNGSRNESDEEILNVKIINGKKIMPQKSN
jgi:hypothetical protein